MALAESLNVALTDCFPRRSTVVVWGGAVFFSDMFTSPVWGLLSHALWLGFYSFNTQVVGIRCRIPTKINSIIILIGCKIIMKVIFWSLLVHKNLSRINEKCKKVWLCGTRNPICNPNGREVWPKSKGFKVGSQVVESNLTYIFDVLYLYLLNIYKWACWLSRFLRNEHTTSWYWMI